jgi:hypothetical protein
METQLKSRLDSVSRVFKIRDMKERNWNMEFSSTYSIIAFQENFEQSGVEELP